MLCFGGQIIRVLVGMLMEWCEDCVVGGFSLWVSLLLISEVSSSVMVFSIFQSGVMLEDSSSCVVDWQVWGFSVKKKMLYSSLVSQVVSMLLQNYEVME